MMDWIKNNFGSKKGMLRDFSGRVGWRFHPAARNPINLSAVERLVFVCKGNICRSAMAQAVSEAAGFPALSFGFDTTPGKPADPGMQRVSERNGYDISSHRTASLDTYSSIPGDLVLFFESAHLAQLSSRMGPVAKTELLGMWARPRRPYIHDPYGGSPIYYARVAGLIRQSVNNLVEEIRSQHGS